MSTCSATRQGDVLYVGKAKSLRSRVRSYFQRGDGRQGMAQLVGRIADLEVIVTRNEAEALHLEQNLVKRHRPPFNIRLRDDKSFPYIAVTLTDEFPRVMFTRERHRRGTVYFGPYANAKKVRETLDVLNRVFKFRPCEGPRPGRHSGIPCLDFHIDRCFAPCVAAIGKEEYGEIIDGVVQFLSGETDPILRELEQRMQEAAADERFEEAARYRNRLFSIRHLADRQAADKRAVGTVDVIGLAIEGDRAAVQIFPLRDGKMIDRYGFHLENVVEQDELAVLEAFVIEYYGSAPSIPPEVLVPRETSDTEAIAEFLSERRGSRVVVRAPARGEKRRLVELAVENARVELEADVAHREAERRRRVHALEELREVLNLESLPFRIECFDVSNIQGESIVASMVVFLDGRSKNSHYRTFAIRGLEGQDDVGAIREAISRRFARLRADEPDDSFSCVPNLVVVDGGRGQLAAALAAMEELDLPRVAVIALAKREEEVFVPGTAAPIRLERHSAGLQLLQRIRDEAHRVALRYHRQKRGTKSMETIFEDLPGVGPARRRAILRHFGSAERFLEASQEELEGVPGLPPKTARTLYAQLHKAGTVLARPARRRQRFRETNGAQREHDRREPGDDVRREQQQPHPDAERQQLGARDRSREDVEEERLLGAEPARRQRQERRQARGHLDEQHVLDRLRDVERVEHEPDGHEAKRPVCRLPDRDRPEVGRRVAHDRERLPDAIPEVEHVPVDPHGEDDEPDQQSGEQELGEERTVEQPREVEAAQVGQLSDPGQLVERDRGPEEQGRRGRDVEDREDERARDDRRVAAPRDRPVREDDTHGVSGPHRDDRVDADAGEVGREDGEPRDDLLVVGGDEDVPPRLARAGEPRELAQHGDERRQDVDRREPIEERVDPVEDAGHVLVLPAARGGGQASARLGVRLQPDLGSRSPAREPKDEVRLKPDPSAWGADGHWQHRSSSPSPAGRRRGRGTGTGSRSRRRTSP